MRALWAVRRSRNCVGLAVSLMLFSASAGAMPAADTADTARKANGPAPAARTLSAPSGLVAAYGFEEGTGTTTADASGNGLTGTITQATWTTAGKFGKALTFSGAKGSWVTVANAPALQLTTGMTISAWVKPTAALPQWPSIVMKERTDELTYALYANSNTNQPNINYTSGGEEVNLNAGSAVPVNAWTYLTGTFDGTTLKFFVNGQLVGSKASTASIDTTTGVLRIGGDNVWDGEYFPGVIDEVRIYNRALSPQEIQTDMATPVVGTGGGGGGPDTTAPTVTLSSPASGAVVSGTVTITAAAADNVGVAGVRFFVDGAPIGAEVTAPPFATAWNSATLPDGPHSLTATARDAAGNSAISASVTVSVSNTVVVPTTAYPLKLAPGQRYVVDQFNAPFLIHGEAAWSLIVNLTNEQADAYLEDRRQKGFNALMVNLIEHHFAIDPPRNVYGDAPFLVAGDFSTPNEAYFAHADLILQKAADKGMVVFLDPAYLGFGGGDEGWYQEMSSNGTAVLTTYGQFLGNRYKNYPNIVWLDGGDFDPPDQSLVTAVVNGIKTFDPVHLHTAHDNQGTSPIDEWGGAGWLDLSDVYTYPAVNNKVPVYQKALVEYTRSDWKPFFLAESTYENENNATPTLVRQQAYEALLSGAMGDFFGNRPIWLFDSGWPSALNSRSSQDMSLVKQFFSTRHWERLVPDVSHTFVIAGFKADGLTHSVAARAADGSWGATFLPTARTITVDLSEFSGPVQAHWFDPTSGATTTVSGSPFTNAGTTKIMTPGLNATGAADWVLVFEVN